MSNYKLIIVIDGESANSLFACGPQDLKEYFLPNGLKVTPDDIRKITFEEDLSPEELSEVIFRGRSYKVHSDNYYRDKEREAE